MSDLQTTPCRRCDGGKSTPDESNGVPTCLRCYGTGTDPAIPKAKTCPRCGEKDPADMSIKELQTAIAIFQTGLQYKVLGSPKKTFSPERLTMHTPGCISNTSAGDCNCGYDQQY